MNTISPPPVASPRAPDARTRLLDAAVSVIRRKGYAGASVDDLCKAAGATKGAFFHHFKSKDDLAVAAAQHWSETTGAMFAAADYHRLPDPAERVLAYVDLRMALLEGAPEEFTCLVGTMAQETFATHPAIAAACEASISGHARTLEQDISESMERAGGAFDFTPQSLALHTQAVLQGAFILAKCKGDASVARESVAHLRGYLRLLLQEKETHDE